MNGIGILLLIVNVAAAQSRPDWVEHFDREDSNYRYYVGRSGPVGTEVAAVQQATWDAIETATRENYGVTLEVTSSSYESESSSSETKHSLSQSDRVSLKEFENVDQFVEKMGEAGHYTAWVKFRYSKRAIEREKERLASSASIAP
jgi:hypothetical protein